MAESHILAQSNPIAARQVCIYRCDSGCIHILYGYVNIGMPPECFRSFSMTVNKVWARIQDHTWSSPHVTLHYGSTMLILSVEEFVAFAEPVREAFDALAGDGVSDPEDDALAEEKCALTVSQCDFN